MTLLNPNKLDRYYPDERSREIMQKTVEFFEKKGKARLKEDHIGNVWYQDFLDFQAENQIFYNLLTPSQYGDENCRWDNWRNCEFNEILGFYGLPYWYTWQVTILGLGPIWMGNNEEVKKKTAQLLKDGGIFAFGLSEREHGADIYSTDMTLFLGEDGKHRARGGKYYIGNGNKAALVSVFGRIGGTDDYVFFTADSQHEKYKLIRNVVNSQNYVSEFELHDYPVTDADILTRGSEAWDSALNTVNVGKYNLGWAGIGICTHAFYEALNHAANRRLYDKFVTDFPHVRQLFVDSYTRLVAMKLFSGRASDYMRAASATDRRYLLFNPLVKMKVTMQSEEVINLLWDVIAAKGFERDTYFEAAAKDIRGLPKLEGTAHVNMALVVKFMQNFLFNPGQFPEVGRRDEGVNDDFLFAQGPTRGLGKIQFHDYKPAYELFDLPNIRVFKEQIEGLKAFLMKATPSKEQSKDVDYLLSLGEIFSLIPYGQLILEAAKIYGTPLEVLDQIFDFMVRDFSKFALQLFSKPSSTPEQMDMCMKMIRKPAVDAARFQAVWENHVYALEGEYEMEP